jgi:hypothetical protein
MRKHEVWLALSQLKNTRSRGSSNCDRARVPDSTVEARNLERVMSAMTPYLLCRGFLMRVIESEMAKLVLEAEGSYTFCFFSQLFLACVSYQAFFVVGVCWGWCLKETFFMGRTSAVS